MEWFMKLNYLLRRLRAYVGRGLLVRQQIVIGPWQNMEACVPIFIRYPSVGYQPAPRHSGVPPQCRFSLQGVKRYTIRLPVYLLFAIPETWPIRSMSSCGFCRKLSRNS
jgi:hypothetical protein